jgi:hypothetical protein
MAMVITITNVRHFEIRATGKEIPSACLHGFIYAVSVKFLDATGNSLFIAVRERNFWCDYFFGRVGKGILIVSGL